MTKSITIQAETIKAGIEEALELLQLKVCAVAGKLLREGISNSMKPDRMRV